MVADLDLDLFADLALCVAPTRSTPPAPPAQRMSPEDRLLLHQLKLVEWAEKRPKRKARESEADTRTVIEGPPLVAPRVVGR